MPFVEGCLYLILTLSLVMLIIPLTDPRLHKELSTLSNEFFYNYRRGLESLNYIFSESINDPKILLKLGQIFFVRNKRNDVRSFFENITGLLDTLISCKNIITHFIQPGILVPTNTLATTSHLTIKTFHHFQYQKNFRDENKYIKMIFCLFCLSLLLLGLNALTNCISLVDYITPKD